MDVTAVIKASCISNYFSKRYNFLIHDMNLLEIIVERIRISSNINNIVIATTDSDEDKILINVAKRIGVEFFRGKYDDSLGRVCGASNLTNSDIIVKVFGNYPLVDPWMIDRLLGKFIGSPAEYAYNEHHDGVILGLGVEIFSHELIAKAEKEIVHPTQRRFGTAIFKNILSQNKILVDTISNPRPKYRVSLAVPNDILIAEQIIKECKDLNHDGIVKYLDDNPILVGFSEQNIAGPKEVGVEKILLFPNKVKSIADSKSDTDYSYPISVELSLTNKCNLKCKWCSDIDLRHKNMTDIPFEMLGIMFQDLANNGTKGIVIEGGGEPTLYSQFNDVVKLVKRYGLGVGLITNNVICQYLDLLPLFDWIRISLDASNREEFLLGKGKDYFDSVINNIENIVKNKGKNGPTIGVAYVLTNNNEKNIEQLIINLREIGVDYVQIRPVIDHPELMPTNTDIQYLQKHSTDTFTVNIHNMSENVIQGNLHLPCRAHSLSTVITANGDVFFCGRLNKYDWLKPIGNLNEQSFADIWHGEERQKQAKMVLSPQFCREWCPECRLTKFNVLFENTSKIKTSNFI